MSESEDSRSVFVFTIPPPDFARILLLVLGTPLLLMFFWLMWKLGDGNILRTFYRHPYLALVLTLMFVPSSSFIAILAYLPASWRARIECSPKHIRLRPRPIDRWMGEPSAEIPINLGSSEVLICRGSRGSLPVGFRLIVRRNDGSEQQIAIESGDHLSLRQAELLIRGTATATGLPVHTVQIRLSADGKSEQIPWTPHQRTLPWIGMSAMLFGSLPFIGGATAGYFCSNPAIIVLIGFLLWLLQTAVVISLPKKSSGERHVAAFQWLTTIFTFSASYAAAAAVAYFFTHK